MHHKNIKLLIRKQLKKQYPNWRLLSKKEKNEIARKVLAEVTAEYDFKSEITASPSQLLGIEQQVTTTGIKVVQRDRPGRAIGDLLFPRRKEMVLQAFSCYFLQKVVKFFCQNEWLPHLQ